MILIPLTEEARGALGGKTRIEITHVPFKVGRECRVPTVVGRLANVVERRVLQVPPLNDVYLIERSSPDGFQVSREHFLIDQRGSHILLRDRRSTCGTWVGERAIDPTSEDPQIELHDGDVIIVGRHNSPYRYQFHLWG